MYLSERRVLILLKREFERLDTMHNKLQGFHSKSRNGWIKYITNAIETSSLVFHQNASSSTNLVQIFALIPDNEQLKVTMSIINPKKCTIRTIDPKIKFSNHFYWRAMQSRQTESVLDIKDIIQKLALIILDSDMQSVESQTYMDDMVCAIRGLGMAVIAVDLLEDGDTLAYTVKTFIDKKSLTGKNLSKYKKLIRSGSEYSISAGNKQLRRAT